MKIAVNTRLLLKNKLEGIGWFTFENFKRITQQHPEHEFIFIFDRKFDDSFIFSSNISPVVVNPPARHPFLFYLWFEHMIPGVLKKLDADIFVSPDGYLSLKSKVPAHIVLHDLNFEHYPQDVPRLVRKHYRYYFPRYAKKASRIATVSEFSKSDIIKQYNADPEKIDVVFNGANEAFKPIDEDEKSAIKNEFTGGNPYFVFVGALHPRKNLVNLFKAFDQFKLSDQFNTKLVIVGEKMWWTNDIRNAFENLSYKEDVIFTGRLKMEKLSAVVGGAVALTYVSYFEGFGIPIVEAFNSKTAVITSNVTSMPEVAGEAALLVDPFSISSISDAMLKISVDTKLRSELIARGIDQKKEFTWQKSSERLWISILKTLD